MSLLIPPPLVFEYLKIIVHNRNNGICVIFRKLSSDLCYTYNKEKRVYGNDLCFKSTQLSLTLFTLKQNKLRIEL